MKLNPTRILAGAAALVAAGALAVLPPSSATAAPAPTASPFLTDQYGCTLGSTQWEVPLDGGPGSCMPLGTCPPGEAWTGPSMTDGVCFPLDDPGPGVMGAVTITFDPVPDQTLEPGQSVHIQLHATSDPVRTITYIADGLPAGVTLDPATGVISGTAPAQDGTFGWLVTAEVGPWHTYTSSQTVTWQVGTPTSTAPGGNPGGGDSLTMSLPSHPNQTFDNVPWAVGGSVAFWIRYDVFPDMTVTLMPTFTATGLPPGVTLDRDSGIVSGELTRAGTYHTTFTGTYGTATATATMTWDVAAAASSSIPVQDRPHLVPSRAPKLNGSFVRGGRVHLRHLDWHADSRTGAVVPVREVCRWVVNGRNVGHLQTRCSMRIPGSHRYIGARIQVRVAVAERGYQTYSRLSSARVVRR